MPKMKTHRSGAKRYRVTATGKLIRKQAGRSHLNEHMNSRQKRNLDHTVVVDDSLVPKIKTQLPYLKYSR